MLAKCVMYLLLGIFAFLERVVLAVGYFPFTQCYKNRQNCETRKEYATSFFLVQTRYLAEWLIEIVIILLAISPLCKWKKYLDNKRCNIACYCVLKNKTWISVDRRKSKQLSRNLVTLELKHILAQKIDGESIMKNSKRVNCYWNLTDGISIIFFWKQLSVIYPPENCLKSNILDMLKCLMASNLSMVL